MSLTDTIADALTRIRNASSAKKTKVAIPASKMIGSILEILKNKEYVMNYKLVEDKRQGVYWVYLKYDNNGAPVINGLQRISKPGLRRYVDKKEIPIVIRGYGMAILSTSKGIMTNEQAKESGVGGEVVCYVW